MRRARWRPSPYTFEAKDLASKPAVARAFRELIAQNPAARECTELTVEPSDVYELVATGAGVKRAAEEIWQDWMWLGLRALWMIRYLALTCRVQVLMGCDKKYPYEVDEKSGWKKVTRFLLDDEELKEEAPKAPDAALRIIGEEIVGKYKGLSKGQKMKPVEDPKTCKHPVPYMRKGGNKNRTYCTCGRCSSMWERQPIPDRSQTPVDHSDLMLFGRFGNCTY